MPGPVTVRFDRNMAVTIPEIKLVRNDECLVLLGADAMVSTSGPWVFKWVGFDEGG